MTARILLLGNDRDYYGANTSPDSVAAAVHATFGSPQHMSLGAAFLQHVADCSVVMPAYHLHPYGAFFPKHVAASGQTTLVNNLNRLVEELILEGDSHKADYVFIHSLEIEIGHSGGDLSAWAQMLNVRQGIAEER